jgi:hypothetical protein
LGQRVTSSSVPREALIVCKVATDNLDLRALLSNGQGGASLSRLQLLISRSSSPYGVETPSLVQAVKRNLQRFPGDFMFQVTADEAALEITNGISSAVHGGRRYAPYAFAEHGVAMLAAVPNSPRAIQVSIEIVRAFVRLRAMLAGNAELARKLTALEKKYDAQFRVVFDAIRDLMTLPAKPRRPIGFSPR